MKLIAAATAFKFFFKKKTKCWQFCFRLNLKEARNAKFNSVNITSFEVTYINCPATVYNLARYVNSPGSRDQHQAVRLKGTCVKNAEPAPPYHDLFRLCDFNGESTYQGSCWCKAAYESKNTSCSGITKFGNFSNFGKCI